LHAMQALSQLSYTPRASPSASNENACRTVVQQALLFDGGVDGTRTRDPRRDRPVF
jgi:hypothetical protein